MFMNNEIKKTYVALCRGFLPEKGVIDYPLLNNSNKLKDAITEYAVIRNFEIPIPSGKFTTSRYSLVEVRPQTGRMHQIRKHFAHIFHPIIGDRPHGCNKQNKLFLEQWGIKTMFLHAGKLEFTHPDTNVLIVIQANRSNEFDEVITLLDELNLNQPAHK